MPSPLFIDFEASGLDRHSWPIEIGAAWIEGEGLGRTVQVWSSLIRPERHWPMSCWSEHSAAVHGIPLDELRRAPRAEEVAREFLRLAGGSVIVSDAPEFDGRWLGRLLDSVDHNRQVEVRDFDALAFARFKALQLDRVYERLARIRVPHRAGPDAQRLARGWLAGLMGA